MVTTAADGGRVTVTWTEHARSAAAPNGGKTKDLKNIETSLQELIFSCNKDGMESLRKVKNCRHDPQLKAAFEQLKYAEAVLLANSTEQDNTALLAVTCNNLGCYYKKVGKYHGALSYLRRALKMEVEMKTDEVTVASTHLNICSILSKLGKHDKAVQHSLTALEIMSNRVTCQDPPNMSQDDYAVLAVAYHSVAKEREFFEQWDQAALAFRTGYQVAHRLLGEDHTLSDILGRSCEAVLLKSRANSKVKPRATRAGRMETKLLQETGRGDSDDEGGLPAHMLPQIDLGAPAEGQDGSGNEKKPTKGPTKTDWKGEEALWINFAARALKPDTKRAGNGTIVVPPVKDPGGVEAEDFLPHIVTSRRPPLAVAALRDLQEANHTIPKAYDMGSFRMDAVTQRALVKQTPFMQAMENYPEAIIEIMDAEGDGTTSKVQDYRPNRAMKRQTRTSRVVRRTGVFNSMVHRDRVEHDLQGKRHEQTGSNRSKETQRLAVIRIQRVWRSWSVYLQANSEWMTITWICATMIQSHWRSYHVRRMRMDGYAKIMQRHMKGFLVRRVMLSHGAAVTIQRRVIGMLTREKLRKLHTNAVQMQKIVRGGLARRSYAELLEFKTARINTIQRFVRRWMAYRGYESRLKERRRQERLYQAVIDLQRYFLGWRGRKRALEQKIKRQKMQTEFNAAVKIQNLYRSKISRQLVDNLREQRIAEMEKAATFLRKVWMGARTKKRYKQLRLEYIAAESKIITIQRYMRGCMCRSRLWREAIQLEEEHWAACEIQRTWRGYMGRVRFEIFYEDTWSKETGAAMIQRNARGWLARLKIRRKTRAIALAKFVKAQAKYQAAQKIQALARGAINRKETVMQRVRTTWAAVQIQRHVRGWNVRVIMLAQASVRSAVRMTAAAKGYLVRVRMRKLRTKVVIIQKRWRVWRNYSKEHKEAATNFILNRKFAANIIQRQFRQCVEHRELQRIAAVVH